MSAGTTMREDADRPPDPMGDQMPECFVDPGQGECPVCGLFDLLGRKWTLHIVWTLRERGAVRFNELKRQADGISPRVLSDRLDELAEQGLVERRAHDETPPRVEYELTEKGRDLDGVLAAYADWADRWDGWGPPEDGEAGCC